MSDTVYTINNNDSEQLEESYDDPSKTEWIVSVDRLGAVSIMVPPDIHYSFFYVDNAEEIGIDPIVDWGTGVYKIQCTLSYHNCVESGQVDSHKFNIYSKELLWEPVDITYTDKSPNA